MSDTLQQKLLYWYRQNQRKLPWRENTDPYSVWVSEIMLQQTTVATVLPFYDRWMERFPSVEKLALATDDEVLTLWQGLGYYRRARYLQQGARQIAKNGWPESAKKWKKIPGVGDYTSSAIASICLNEPVACVDGNVERVYARINADESPHSELKKKASTWSNALVCRESPGDWNQALMELGATVCTPQKPKCESCPVQENCLAFKQELQAVLPTPKLKPETVELRHQIWIPVKEGKFGVRQVPVGKWWEGMFEFPREEDTEFGKKVLFELLYPSKLTLVGRFKHVVTKHKITVEVFLSETKSQSLDYYSESELTDLPMPSPCRKAFDLLLKSGELPKE